MQLNIKLIEKQLFKKRNHSLYSGIKGSLWYILRTARDIISIHKTAKVNIIHEALIRSIKNDNWLIKRRLESFQTFIDSSLSSWQSNVYRNLSFRWWTSKIRNGQLEDTCVVRVTKASLLKTSNRNVLRDLGVKPSIFVPIFTKGVIGPVWQDKIPN